MRVPYSILSIQMEKLFNKQFDPDDIIGMEEHCELMINYVESCGWTIEDFILRMFND